MNGAIVDTGFLIALFDPSDKLRAAAREFLQNNRHPLLTVAPVIVETCFFLDPEGKAKLLEWVQRGAVAVAEVPTAAYAEIRALILKCAARNLDFADAAIVWFAERTGCRSLLTVDISDFSIVRMRKGKRFEPVKWFEP
ncbi:MAG TPA: PIN domain-containing protein [Burkholderiales bacterium]|nr:PIN domain-containing protein [Burkholderiales bacterium]